MYITHVVLEMCVSIRISYLFISVLALSAVLVFYI